MPRVLICVPTFETIYPDTYKALWDMEKPDGTDFEFVRGYDVATARNKCAQKMLEGPYTHLMMVDNDVTVPKDALMNLLEHDVDAVMGYYAHRGADNVYDGRTCACKVADDNGTPYFNYPLESEYTADEMRALRESGENLVRVHGGGMGCALVKAEVFMRCEYPWFDWVNYNDPARSTLSEDLYFCEVLKAEGIPIYADTRVACGHLLRHIQMPE